MGLGKLFIPKKPKPAIPDTDDKPPEEKNDVPSPEKPEPSLKPNDVNVVYPFHDEKATSFPPPLSIDASVYTDVQNLPAPVSSEIKTEKTPPIEEETEKEGSHDDEKEKKDEVKGNKMMFSSANGACDSKSCTKEGCSPETCETTLKKPHDSGDKISPVKLTEMINSSIKEAMQTIVKQCKMEEEKDLSQKPKKELDKPVCSTKEEISAKAKQFDRSRSLKNSVKLIRPQDKYNVRPLKKCHEESVKGHAKRETVCEEARNKRHSKSANNVKTDNRRMTGNVNIYICSEATENTQATSKQKKSPPCMGTSSETTTAQSHVSSSKLMTSIQKKRRKCKEQGSFDFLPKRESSDDSNDCSCVTKYTDSSSTAELGSSDLIDICNALSENVSTKDTDSSSNASQCKNMSISNSDVTDKSSSSFPRSKFVICDKRENPCTSIYPSQILSSTDSEKWSSKSICSSIERVSYGINGEVDREIVPCDEDRKDIWSLGSKSTCSNYHTRNLSRDYDTNEDECYKMHSKRNFADVCKCHKKDREFLGSGNAQNNYRSKRRKSMGKENVAQPWSTCSCIAEEEEEDVTVCQKAPKDVKGHSAKYVACKTYSTDSKKNTEKLTGGSDKELVKEVENVEEGRIGNASEAKEAEDTEQQKSEQQQNKNSPIPPAPLKVIKPEARLLKYIRQQHTKPLAQSTDQKNVTTPPVRNINKPEELTDNISDTQTEKKAEPAFLKKFNFPQHRKLSVQPVTEQNKQTLTQETAEKKLKDNEHEGDKETKKSFQEKTKVPLFYKLLKKIAKKEDRSKIQSEMPVEKDDTAENTPADIGTSNKTEIPIAKSADKLPRKPTNEVKEMPKERKKSIPSKVDKHNLIEGKNKTETNTNPSGNTPANKENQNSIVNDVTPKSSDSVNKEKVKREEKGETPLDVTKETQHKPKLLTNISNRKLNFSSTQNGTELTKEAPSQEHRRKSESEQITKLKIQEGRKESEVRRRSSDWGQQEPESQKATTRDEVPSNKKMNNAHSELEVEAPTVCAQCVRRKSSLKVPKQAASSQYMHHHEANSHTICTNFTIDDERLEEISCNCCYLPISQCNNSLTNYPKSCLKKERQFCRIGSQESNLLSSCHDNRSWQECSCRRMIVCNNCCRPRNECSCTVMVTCVNCCKPKNECNCKSVHKGRENFSSCRCMKSMFCLYCDNPREECTCRSPMRKCSCCELSVDLCMCKDRKTCDGRPVLAEPVNDRTMYVTAWKPREEVRRYFSRNLEDIRADSINECRCHEKQKLHNSDDLPYQRLSVFSDVMDELQQKITESTCCTCCRKIPCCCNLKAERDEGREERKIKCRVSPKARRKILAVCMEKSRSKSPNVCCKCDSGQAKSDRPKKIVVPLCCACKSTPCRCKKSKSSQKKPKAKCYYCKSSPCVCIAVKECIKPRPCRCADSPCRTKEKEITSCGKPATKSKNNEEKIICVR